MQSPTTILQQYWGYTTFRSLQKEIIEAVLQDKDVLALMPTGGGKSICFQIPALLKPHLTLVISPLIALMQDQVRQLHKRKIPAAAIYTGMSSREVDLVLNNCIQGATKMLYLSPEKLLSTRFLSSLLHMKISLLAVDEAHCISQWGYNFRPAYLQIPKIKKHLPQVPLIALTATATPQVQVDIQEKLAMQKPILLKKSFARQNLAYVVRNTHRKIFTLITILKKITGCAIVYAPTREATEVIAQNLQAHNISADFYHAGLSMALRGKKQEAWLKEVKRVMVATSAFGMGIDKPNVRIVIHTEAPTTLEAYYQEAGRAGRDDKKAYAVVLYNGEDDSKLMYMIVNSHPEVKEIKMMYQLLANYLQVAVGSHAMVTYDIDMEDFAALYRLKVPKVYNSIRQLESEELVKLDERYFVPAKIHIKLTHKQLYNFQVANPPAHPLLQKLHHLYQENIFNNFCAVSLKRLARTLNTTPQALHTQLQHLDDLEVVAYSPSTQQAKLTFLTPRYAIQALPISKTKLTQRRDLLCKKTKAVLHYAAHKYRCRSQLLLEYFGEVSYKRCQICDRCLEQNKYPAKIESYYTHYQPIILKLLQNRTCTVEEIVAQIDLYAKEDICCTIQVMLEKREIRYGEAFKLVVL